MMRALPTGQLDLIEFGSLSYTDVSMMKFPPKFWGSVPDSCPALSFSGFQGAFDSCPYAQHEKQRLVQLSAASVLDFPT